MKSVLSVSTRQQACGLALVAGVLALGPWLAAQTGAPARAVRLSSVDGQVQLAQGGQTLAAQALANTPLFEGAQITTAEDGRAEIQLEDGSVARVSPNSSLTLGALGAPRQEGTSPETELVLNGGLGYFELEGDAPAGHLRVRFGSNTVTASGFTVLRVNLDNPPGEVAVFSGNAHVESGNMLSLDIHGGESVKLNGADPGNYALSEAIEPDSWDAWNSDRDQALTAQEAERTQATNSLPNANNPAWSDLDANGNWYNMPGQGYVWSPYQAQSAGWEPYGCGSWMWTPGYGYIWVSCEPWGFMPYASGMWNYYDGLGWGWAPGLGGMWWGGGGWGYNIGSAPFRYDPPRRPRGGPVRPGGPGNPIRAGGRYQPFPVVAVNRIHDIAAAPARPRGTPITVAGNTLVPLRPVVARPVYGRTTSGEGARGPIAYPGTGAGTGVRYGYAPGPGVSRPGTWNGMTGGRPLPAYGGSAGARTSIPSAASSSSAAGRGSSGGGGAGASHASPGGSFGGGGGGGAPHASGGGGGGGSHH